MKSIFKTFALSTVLAFFVFTANAQAPQSFSYQAIARNGNSILANANIGVQFLIRDISPTGTVIYSETNNLVTNPYGLFTAMIGIGSQQTGNFSNIDWANGGKFLQVKIDVTGGTNYVDLGTTQLISVPYALHANKADTAAYAVATTPVADTEFATYEDKYPDTVIGPLPTSGTWNTANLNNTQSSSGTSISRSGTTITLQPGTYRINAWANSHFRGNTTGWCSYNVRLKNLTTSTVALRGHTTEDYVNPSYTKHFSTDMQGVIVVPATQTFVMEYWYWAQYPPIGVSNNTSDPSEEVFGSIYIEKIK